MCSAAGGPVDIPSRATSSGVGLRGGSPVRDCPTVRVLVTGGPRVPRH